jgi:LacI family repressor for deo operon, udp, cdd, tsx, nupC, and nupG
MGTARQSAPRMRDVARLAGVSLTTVSRSFSAPGQVSPDARERIEAAIRQLDYTVNINAQNLRRRSSGVVLVLLPDIGNPFFPALLKGIEETASGTGRAMLVGETGADPARAVAYARYLDSRRADGMILLDGRPPSGLVERGRATAASPHPVVVVSERIPGAGLPTVGIDNVRAARDAIDLLASSGHRRIAHIGGPPGNVLTLERRRGYEEGLAAHGLGAGGGLVADGDFSIESGRLAARRLLAADPRPTAIFAGNDEMAVGAIAELKASGLRVPEDVSVVGFDDIEFAAAYDPPITTIRQPRRDMGRAAMSLLADLLEQRRPGGGEVVLGHELVLRASAGPVSASSFQGRAAGAARTRCRAS